MRGNNALQVGRRHVTTSPLLVLEGGKEYDFRTDGSTELLGVAMESSMFTDLDGGCHSVVRRALKQNVVPLAPTATMMLRHFWLMMAQIVQNEDTGPSSMPMSLLADSALNNVLQALDMSTMQQSQPLPPSTKRQALVVRHAIRYMKTHLDQHFTMADVCENSHGYLAGMGRHPTSLDTRPAASRIKLRPRPLLSGAKRWQLALAGVRRRYEILARFPQSNALGLPVAAPTMLPVPPTLHFPA